MVEFVSQILLKKSRLGMARRFRANFLNRCGFSGLIKLMLGIIATRRKILMVIMLLYWYGLSFEGHMYPRKSAFRSVCWLYDTTRRG